MKATKSHHSSYRASLVISLSICFASLTLASFRTNAQSQAPSRVVSIQLSTHPPSPDEATVGKPKKLTWPSRAVVRLVSSKGLGTRLPILSIQLKIGPIPSEFTSVSLESPSEGEEIQLSPQRFIIGRVARTSLNLHLGRGNAGEHLVVHMEIRDQSNAPLIDPSCTKNDLALSQDQAQPLASTGKSRASKPSDFPMVAIACAPITHAKGLEVMISTGAESSWDSSTIPERAGKGERWKLFSVDPSIIRTNSASKEILAFQLLRDNSRFNYQLVKTKDGSGPGTTPISPDPPTHKPLSAAIALKASRLTYVIPTYDPVDATQALIDANLALEPFEIPLVLEAGWSQSILTLQASGEGTPSRSEVFAAALYRFKFGPIELSPGVGFAVESLSVPSAGFSSGLQGPMLDLPGRWTLAGGTVGLNLRYASVSNENTRGSALSADAFYGLSLSSFQLRIGLGLSSLSLTPSEAGGEASAKGVSLNLGVSL